MSRKEYKYFIWSILFVIMGIFVFPLIVTKYGINIKNCSENIHCVSCGITRDFYQIIALEKNNNLINSHSFYIFLILLSSILVSTFCMVLLVKVLFYQFTAVFNFNLVDVNIFEFNILLNLSFYILIFGIYPQIFLQILF